MSGKIDAFIIGAPRTMTTKITNSLMWHPEISCAPEPECKYFDAHYGEESYLEKRFDFSEDQFDLSGRKTTVYSNPAYCSIDFVRDRIFNHNNAAKIIICVRNPIERCISHFGVVQSLSVGRTKNIWDEFDRNLESFSTNKFKSELDYIPYLNKYYSCLLPNYFECSLYYRIYRRYACFTDLLILNFDDMENDFQGSFDQVTDFIEVDRLQVDPKPVNSLQQRGSSMVISDHVQEFIYRYPEIVHLFTTEALAIGQIFNQRVAEDWDLI